MTMPGKLAFNVDEAAAAIGVSRTRIFQAINKGELRSFKDGRRRIVSQQALRDFIAKRERESLKGVAR
ncbi:helix-turn-helix domain-containing protein [Luteimonas sp. e5]